MILRTILYSIIAFVVYSVFRRVMRMFTRPAPSPGNTGKQHSDRDGAVEAEYEELD